MELSTNQKGILAELKVRQRAMELGMMVSVPTDSSARYDAIIDDGHRLYRAQIKYCDRSGGGEGALQIELTSYHRSGKLSSVGYSAKEIDVLLLDAWKLQSLLTGVVIARDEAISCARWGLLRRRKHSSQ